MLFPDQEVAGVILTGGQSLRMKSPKALLPYKGMLLYQYMGTILQSVCKDIFLSHNSKTFTLESAFYPIIEDKYLFHGPISGILSSLEYLQKPIFILPCDTPLLSVEVLQNLLKKRNSSQFCTVYYNEQNSFYEPLIGVWEPSAIKVLTLALNTGVFSLQKILNEHTIDKNPLPESTLFKNVNTKDDFKSL